MTDDALFWDVATAARFLGVSPATAYRAIDDGKFPVKVIRVGGRIKVPARALYALAGVPVDRSPAVDRDTARAAS